MRFYRGSSLEGCGFESWGGTDIFVEGGVPYKYSGRGGGGWSQEGCGVLCAGGGAQREEVAGTHHSTEEEAAIFGEELRGHLHP